MQLSRCSCPDVLPAFIPHTLFLVNSWPVFKWKSMQCIHRREDFVLDQTRFCLPLRAKPTRTRRFSPGGNGNRKFLAGRWHPPFWPKTIISRIISTLESGNLPYHVKTICSYQKNKQFYPENAGNGICETLYFKILPGEDASRSFLWP